MNVTIFQAREEQAAIAQREWEEMQQKANMAAYQPAQMMGYMGQAAGMYPQQMAGQPMAGQQMAGQPMAGQQMVGQQMVGQQMVGPPMAGQQMPPPPVSSQSHLTTAANLQSQNSGWFGIPAADDVYSVWNSMMTLLHYIVLLY